MTYYYLAVAVAGVLGALIGLRVFRATTLWAYKKTGRCPVCEPEVYVEGEVAPDPPPPVRMVGVKPDWERPSGPASPKRDHLYGIGDTLRTHHNFVGAVETIYADYYAARCSNVIPRGWFEMQTKPPSTKDQIFYGLVALDGKGAVLVGEAEAGQA